MNKEYCAERNKLIPKAEKYANEKFGSNCSDESLKEDWLRLWNSCYHQKMDSLWREEVRKAKSKF